MGADWEGNMELELEQEEVQVLHPVPMSSLNGAILKPMGPEPQV